MKRFVLSILFVIVLAGAVTACYMSFANTNQPAQPETAETPAPSPEPAPPPEPTPTPTPAPAISLPEEADVPEPTPTPAPTPTPVAETQQDEYAGWPAIPESQLPQPDKPSTEIIIPANNQISNYNGTTVLVTPDTVVAKDPGSPDYLAEEIFLRTNTERASQGLNKLAYAYDLQGAADTRAREIAVLFSHTRPNGGSCHDVVPDQYHVAGENIILADKPIATAENLMAEWMSSPGHRANILLKDFTGLAVGVYEQNGIVYAVQIFVG